MNKKEKYFRAAKEISNNTALSIHKALFCCVALNNSNLSSHDFESFERLFKPDDVPSGGSWFGETTPKNQLARSLALLFMAEMEDS